MKLSQDSWTGKDKVLHLVIGFSLTFLLYCSARFLEMAKVEAIVFSLVMPIFCEFMKEYFDQDSTGFSYKDLIYGLVGNLIALGVVCLFH